MSILSQLLDGKISLTDAFAEAESWGQQVIAKAPAEVQAAITQDVADIKVAASNALTVADSLAGPIITTGTAAVEAAFTTAVTTYLGPFGAAVAPAGLDAINTIAKAFHNELDTLTLQLKAQLAASAPTSTTPATPPAS